MICSPPVKVTLDGTWIAPEFELVNVMVLFVRTGAESRAEQEMVCPPVTDDGEQRKD